MRTPRIQPSGLLSGLRILDLTRLLPGPAATQQLADLGAEILKIEDPQGDPARYMGAPRGNAQAFQTVNRHKRFAVLDLKSEEGRRGLLSLVAQADALIESFRPGTLEKLGVGWESLQAVNPRLVLCSISGYGQQGPYAQRAGHDINYLALAGALHQLADADDRAILPGLPLADMLGAQAAAAGIIAALLHAHRQGQGVHLDIALVDAALNANPLALASCNAGDTNPPAGQGLLNGGTPCYGLYRCADEAMLAVGALELKFWQVLVRGMELPQLADQHWSLGLRPGSEASRKIQCLLAERFAQATREVWLERLEALDCCVTPLLTPEQALQHPLFRQRQASGLWESNSNSMTAQHWVAPPVRVVNTGFSPVRGAQALGQDNPPDWLRRAASQGI